MKLTLIFTLLAFLTFGNGFSQSKVTLHFEKATIQQVLKTLEDQTGHVFLYKDDIFDPAIKYSVDFTDESFEEVLNSVCKTAGVDYEVRSNRQIILTEKEKETVTAITFQQRTVSGVVTDQRGLPLPGVTVVVKGTTTGTVTNADGAFSLAIPNDAEILQFSFVGMVTQEVPIEGRTTFTVVMAEETIGIEEVVAIGYGTQKKANLTGAVDQVSSEVFQNRTVTNLTQGLQGVMPNVNIRLLDGNPSGSPAINIRGLTSIGAGGEALVLIDGVEGDPRLLNPNDIESISVLKDAASAAIYGARGTFGVVLITTKSAAVDKTEITYSANFSVKQPTKTFNHITDSYTFAKMFNEAYSGWFDYSANPNGINKTIGFSSEYLAELKRRSEDPSLPKTDINPGNGQYWYFHNTDWYKELQKSSLTANEHNLSISGGTEKTTFYLSGRYFFQEGLFRYNSDDYQTANIRARGSTQVFPWLQLENNFEYSNLNYHYPIDGAGEQVGPWAMIALEHFPMSTLLNPDGTITYSAAYGIGDFYYGKNAMDQIVNRFRNTIGAKATFFDEKLRINSDFTYSFNSSEDRTKRVPVPYSVRPGVTEWLGATKNDLQDTYNRTGYIAANLYGEFEDYFDEVHYLKLMGGVNYEKSEYKRILARRDGLIFPDAEDINLAVGENIFTQGGYERWRTFGTFVRFNYIFDNRYLFEFNGRYDGSSKFPSNERFAFFPSISVGWRASQESWFNLPENIISDIKLRGSYGSLGNGNISSYRFQELYSVNQHSRVLNGARPAYTSMPSILPDGLTWETSTTFNFGLDILMISNKLQLTGDIYERYTKDMFTVGPALPAVFGASPPRGNYADLKTNGWELVAHWRDNFKIKNQNFNYKVRLNLADNKSKIMKYNNPDKRLNDYYEGQTYGEIWGYVTEGFFTSLEDIENHADQTLIQNSSGRKLLPGDVKFKDLNNDEIINAGNITADNPGDRKIIGNSEPRYTYGIRLDADWKNFFTNVFFQGVGKQDWYPSAGASIFWGQYNRPYNTIPEWHLDPGIIWSEDNPDSYLPRYRGYSRLGSNELGRSLLPQTKYLQDVRYIRLKSFQFGYNLPATITSKINASTASVYLTGENLWSWSPLYKITKDIDPEGIRRSDSIVRPSASYNAGDGYNYPMLGSLSIGLSITF
jgi:TonB-linked SusC/RagA family outer membrane protein